MSIDSDQSSTRILWDRDEDFTINYRAPTGPRRLYYEAWSEVGEPTPEQLQTSSDDYTSVPDSDFRTLTDHELRDSTQAFVRELTRDAATVYDKAVAIQTWLSGPDFLYSLNLPELPPDYAVDAFIMQTRKGHCELFASAMALMLRSLGVPTRVVSGYRGGEWNDTDGTYMVRQYMAHLWVEVYFPDVGWVRFDPSPSDANFIDRVGKFRRMLSTYILKSKMFWYQEVIGFAGAFQLAKLREFSMGVVGGFLGQDRVSGGTSPTGSRIRVGPIIGMIGLIGLATLILLRGRNANGHRPGQWWTLTQDQTRATRLYERLRRKLTKSGADCYGKTAEELRADLEENRWIEVVPAVRLLQIYCDVRFGGRPLLKAQYQELLAELKRLHPLKK
ncbi:MAG: transglutaminase domain-containing protein [Candidatus Hydrogenedentes bacterium]|nr:transglutaminase domain-containing protein [Candidatus Hydrogenedentota bacterium]